MPKITILDVARLANVSIATVSRVLSGKGSVSEDAAQAVREAAQRLGYKPAAGKGAQDASQGKHIVVMVSLLKRPFYNEVLSGISDAAAHNGYTTFVTQLGEDMEPEPPEYLTNGMMKGLIMLDHTRRGTALLKNVELILPVVQCCDYDDTLSHPAVAVDDYRAAYNAVAYLKSTGRKHVAMLNMSNTFFGLRREAGFRDALKAFKLPTEPEIVKYVPVEEYNAAFSTALEMLSLKDRPDAIFAVTDICAVGILRAARRCGIDVPGELAVVGFDNSDFSAMCDPPLTTVHQPRYEIGSLACSVLLRMIDGQSPASQKVLVDAELIVRAST